MGSLKILRSAEILRSAKIAAKAGLRLKTGATLTEILPIITAIGPETAGVIPPVRTEIAALVAKLRRGGKPVLEIAPVCAEIAGVIAAFPPKVAAIVAAFRAEIARGITLLKRGLNRGLNRGLELRLRLGPGHDNPWHVGARLGKGRVGAHEGALRLRRRGIGSAELTRAGLARLKARAAAIGRTLLAKLWFASETAIVLRECRAGGESDCTQQRDDQRLNHHVLQSSVDPIRRWRRCRMNALSAMSVF